MFSFETIRPRISSCPIRGAFFDYDGTVSLIVEGWQDLLTNLFRNTLRQFPGGDDVSEDRIRQIIDLNTGKKTIAQAVSLVEEVRKLGGNPRSTQEYANEYLVGLDELTRSRIDEVKSGNRNAHLVPGICEFLAMLKEHGLIICLASGSDETVVRNGLEMFGLTEYFDGGIFGTQPNNDDFCKADILDQFLNRFGLKGEEVVGFGDGYTETKVVHKAGGLAVGIALDEPKRSGINAKRRSRLIEANADWIISDYTNVKLLESELFPVSKLKVA